MKVLVIGGGLFGCTIASILAGKEIKVELVEEENDILKLASRVNHNRIHLGYHYLRSIETAEQSIEGLLSFLFHFGDAVLYQFPNYYAIAKEGSKTSPEQFLDFCERVGIGYEEEFPDEDMFDPRSIQACFRVPEPVWDYGIIKRNLKRKLHHPNIQVYMKTKCIGLKQLPDESFEARLSSGLKRYDYVVNCTYANINEVNGYLGLAKKRLLYEDVVIPVFKYSVHAWKDKYLFHFDNLTNRK